MENTPTNNNPDSSSGLLKIFQDNNISILEAAEHLEKVTQFIPTIKELLPKIKEGEKAITYKDDKGNSVPLKLEEGEILTYTIMLTEHEVFCYLSAVREITHEGKKVTASRLIKRFKLIEELEKLASYLPKM